MSVEVPWPDDWIPSQPSLRERWSGHVQTLLPFAARSLRPLLRPPTRAWQTELVDPTVGPVTLSGEWLEQPGNAAIIVVHGLGGSSQSGYMALALQAAQAARRKCLLLNLRGADRRGGDINHAALTDDISAALRSPELQSVRHVDVLGYSLGGHLALAYACGSVDPRLRRVAAIGSPLDLERSSAAFDQPGMSPYRTHVMRSLHEIYTAAYQRRPTQLRPEQARKIMRIREWDERVVAPRFGFASALDYYTNVSVGPKLSGLSVPSLYVGAPADPMIPLGAVLSAAQSPHLRVVWSRNAGHLGFPATFDLGQAAPLGLEHQVLSWLEAPRT